MELAMNTMMRKVTHRTVQTLDKHYDAETQNDNICQLGPRSGWMPPAGSGFWDWRTAQLWFRADSHVGSWTVVVLSTEYEAPVATCSI